MHANAGLRRFLAFPHKKPADHARQRIRHGESPQRLSAHSAAQARAEVGTISNAAILKTAAR
eukprot:2384994-Alexandrium_andersonii.AAC.1